MDDAVIALTERASRYDDIAWNPDDPIAAWIEAGKRNPWIKGAWDPRFDRKSFMKCSLVAELREMFLHGNWALGTAFTYENLCFINQVDGGDEWLTIKNNVVFESMSMRQIIKHPRVAHEFETVIADLLAASLEECKKLDCEGASHRQREAACLISQNQDM